MDSAAGRGNRPPHFRSRPWNHPGIHPFMRGSILEGMAMNNIIYIVGLVVVVLAVLTFFGLR